MNCECVCQRPPRSNDGANAGLGTFHLRRLTTMEDCQRHSVRVYIQFATLACTATEHGLSKMAGGRHQNVVLGCGIVMVFRASGCISRPQINAPHHSCTPQTRGPCSEHSARLLKTDACSFRAVLSPSEPLTRLTFAPRVKLECRFHCAPCRRPTQCRAQIRIVFMPWLMLGSWRMPFVSRSWPTSFVLASLSILQTPRRHALSLH